MRLKSYYVNRVEEALLSAAQELGGEALLVTSKRTAESEWHLGRYEVVFATGTAVHSALSQSVPAQPSALARVREKLNAVRTSLEAISAPAPLLSQPCELVRSQLEDRGIAPLLARDLAQSLESRLAGSARLWMIAACRLLHTRLSSLPEPVLANAPFDGRPTSILLMGPAGRGKTTTLAKLAMLHLEQKDVPVRILSFHPPAVRHEGLRDVPLQCVGSLPELRHAMGRSLVGVTLIDVPASDTGAGPLDGLAQFCRNTPGLRSALVLRADSTFTSLQQSVTRFQVCSPGSLIFTGLDEITTFGSPASISVASQLPVSFLCNGPRVLTEIERASPLRIAELAIYGQRKLKRAAA